MGKAMPSKKKTISAPTIEEVIEGLRCVIDPHTNINVYDMGIVTDLKVSKDTVSMVFRPTSPFCPLAFDLARSMKGRMWDLDGSDKIIVKVVGHYQEDNINKALVSLRPAAAQPKKGAKARTKRKRQGN